jgi:hypothetical protein
MLAKEILEKDPAATPHVEMTVVKIGINTYLKTLNHADYQMQLE